MGRSGGDVRALQQTGRSRVGQVLMASGDPVGADSTAGSLALSRQPRLFRALVLRHPSIMDDKLNNPVVEALHIGADERDPFRKVGLR